MSRLRVLVAEDSLTVRKRLCEVLSADPGIEVVGEAQDGKQAIELCAALRPDVVTLDMMMPVMSGLAATEYLMAYQPTPILVVSSSVNRGELFKTYEALAAGAVEVMEKPRADEAEGEWERSFVGMVKLVAKVRVVTHLRGRRGMGAAADRMDGAMEARPVAAAGPAPKCRAIVMGMSTGGPGAIVQVLRAIPEPFRLPILFVIHIGEPFGSSFAEWLDSQTPHRVRLACDGEPVPSGGVVMAPANRHLTVAGGRLALGDGPERNSCRPSVDALFDSAAAEFGAACAAALLTGMGQDGARGLLAIRNAGGMTVAQDEESSVVYGMPREAALLGAARRVMPLREIGPFLASLAGRGEGR